jgi:hypothetical protein
MTSTQTAKSTTTGLEDREAGGVDNLLVILLSVSLLVIVLFGALACLVFYYKHVQRKVLNCHNNMKSCKCSRGLKKRVLKAICCCTLPPPVQAGAVFAGELVLEYLDDEEHREEVVFQATPRSCRQQQSESKV